MKNLTYLFSFFHRSKPNSREKERVKEFEREKGGRRRNFKFQVLCMLENIEMREPENIMSRSVHYGLTIMIHVCVCVCIGLIDITWL